MVEFKVTRGERRETREERRETRDIVIDLEILKSLQDAVGGEVSFVLGMLEEFIEEAKIQISDAETAYLKDHCKGVQSELHTLKGNSGTLGATEVHRICEIIEVKAKVCDFKQFEHEIIELKNALDDFEKAVHQHFGSK
jgi:HPt (histidine-containing phosphotransfer) domain-containing protein